MKNVYNGNVLTDTKDTRGWFIGHFIGDAQSLRHSNDVEVKWDIITEEVIRDAWSVNETATTMSLVVKGRMKMVFEDSEVVLDEQDYYISKPQTPHKYSIEKNSIILTVRWPSLPTDHQNISK